jgi:hypothetical protein
LALFALGSAAAVASFFVKDHMGIDPKHAMAGLITVPYFLKVLLGREPGLLARVSFYVGGILLLSLWLQYWGW